ncbi:helix-turn-helix domain-containing protein [Gracilibacillus marinus]|uniref:Helix-turn-helix domain-containing protein n=1 Tax=Gracilibacillus marinus TaxID=630535 RepID=A0ABV8VXH1_9BACI
MHYHTINLSELQPLATFKTTADMDEVIYSYIDILRQHNEPESVIDTLLFLGRSSLRITGISFAKYQTIADNIGKSKRTIIRIMNVLEGYGIIEKLPTTKLWRGKSRKKSVNIIRILPMSPQLVTADNAEEVTPHNEIESENTSQPIHYKQFINNSINTYLTSRSVTPYTAFKDAITTYIGNDNQSTVSRLYGVYLGNTKPLRKTEYYSGQGQAELMAAAITAVHETFKATKQKNIRNLAGYFNGVLSNKLDELMAEAMAVL